MLVSCVCVSCAGLYLKYWEGCRTPEEDTAAVDAQADVAPHVQDDFDLDEGTLQELDVKDNPDFQVRIVKVLKPEVFGVAMLKMRAVGSSIAGEAAKTHCQCGDQGVKPAPARQEVPRPGYRLHHLRLE